MLNLLKSQINLKLSKNKSLQFNYFIKSLSIRMFTSATTKDITIFDKIINKEIKSDIVYEDDNVLAFRDINPVAPIHILIIPKKKDGLTGISKAEESHVEILGKLMLTAKKLGEILNLKNGYRIVINEGSHGCQSIFHLHVHFLAGKQFGWPPGTDRDINNKI